MGQKFHPEGSGWSGVERGIWQGGVCCSFVVTICGSVDTTRGAWYGQGMFSINDKETKQLERDLGRLRDRAFPFATLSTLNQTAFSAQRGYKKEIRKDLVTRNKFTEQSIRVNTAKGLNIRRQMSVVGSTAPYMEDQEFGGVKATRGSQGVPIPSLFASGEGRGSQKAKRLPRKPNKLRNISLKHKRTKSKNRKQANLIKIKTAIATGNRTIFLDFGGRSKGIYRVVGGRKGATSGARLEMLWGMERTSVRIPKQPLLRPAYLKASRQMGRVYRSSLRYQIRKFQLFK